METFAEKLRILNILFPFFFGKSYSNLCQSARDIKPSVRVLAQCVKCVYQSMLSCLRIDFPLVLSPSDKKNN